MTLAKDTEKKSCENCSAYGYCDDKNIVPNGKNGFCSEWREVK